MTTGTIADFISDFTHLVNMTGGLRTDGFATAIDDKLQSNVRKISALLN